MPVPKRYPGIAQPGVCWPMLHTEDHDGWLLLDGRTIKRADYPRLFEVLKVTGDTAVLPDFRDRLLIGAGGKLKAGQTGGSSQLTLKPEHLPSHDHAYTDASVTMSPGKAGLLAGVLPIVTGSASSSADKTTAKTGQGAPVDLPTPPHLALSLFVFAGR